MIRGLVTLASLFMFIVGTLMVLVTGLANGWGVIAIVGAVLLIVDFCIEHNQHERSVNGR